jgi:hypothetical protein
LASVEQTAGGRAEPVEGEDPRDFDDERTVNRDTGERDLHEPSLRGHRGVNGR